MTAAICSLQESTTRLVRTTWDEPTFSLQRVAFKIFLGNLWNLPCRSCFFASAASSDFSNSVTSATRPGLVSTSVPRFLEAEGSLHQPIYPIYGKISGQKRDRLERQGLLCFQTPKWTTELQTWAHPLLEARPPIILPTPLSLQEFR